MGDKNKNLNKLTIVLLTFHLDPKLALKCDQGGLIDLRKVLLFMLFVSL